MLEPQQEYMFAKRCASMTIAMRRTTLSPAISARGRIAMAIAATVADSESSRKAISA